METKNESYETLAAKSIMFGFPVSIKDQKYRPDNNISYHISLYYMYKVQLFFAENCKVQFAKCYVELLSQRLIER